MAFLRSYTPDIEQVSVDECYMDFTEIADRFTSPVEGADEIKENDVKDTYLGDQAAAGNPGTITVGLTTTVTQVD